MGHSSSPEHHRPHRRRHAPRSPDQPTTDLRHRHLITQSLSHLVTQSLSHFPLMSHDVLSDDDISSLRNLVTTTQDDLLRQIDEDDDLYDELHDAWEEQKESDRTADSFTDWSERYTEQVAVHWVLTSVFVRYLEDNGLIDEVWLAGMGDAAAEAEDNLSWFWSEHPTASETDYLLHIFRRLAEFPAGDLFGAERNALYKMRPTGDAGKGIVDFFRQVDPDTGELEYTFAVDHSERPGDTRFLGDLYQDLSEDARKRYALLQTPEFVEEFILEHTLEPAIETFGLGPRPGEVTDDNRHEKFRFIDPACGSGHFLLGGFRRVLDHMLREWSGQPRSILVRRALETVHGVDINPFAVEIARFRLLIAALYAIEGHDADPEVTKRLSDSVTKSSGGGAAAANSERSEDQELSHSVTQSLSHSPSEAPKLADAPPLPLKIACGDSLIHGQFHPRFETDKTKNQAQLSLDRFQWTDKFATDDADLIYGSAATTNSTDGGPAAANSERSEDQELSHSVTQSLSHSDERSESGEHSEPGILMQQYHAVVGNPPYITVKDKALNSTYREFYASCYYKYSLVCPFFERFFDLAGGEQMNSRLFEQDSGWKDAGYVGMIVSNSFMKRNFGQKLIEEIIPATDLTHIIDTSGAYIPGHGTPTLILMGRNRAPQRDKLRAALGIRGEPDVPDDPAKAHVWSAIRDRIDETDFENEYVTIGAFPRSTFREHPWTLEGGGVITAKRRLEQNATGCVTDKTTTIGFFLITGADTIFSNTRAQLVRMGVGARVRESFVSGDDIRGWKQCPSSHLFFPYSREEGLLDAATLGTELRWLTRFRAYLYARPSFGGGSYRDEGRRWYQFHQFPFERFLNPTSIAFAEVATHNHFVLDRGGKVFNRTAPVIKLPDDATEEDHLRLLGPLNSSTGCFWMKQTFHNKGYGADAAGARNTKEPWEDFYQRDGTKLKQFPLPSHSSAALPARLDALGQQLADTRPREVSERQLPTPETLNEAREKRRDKLRAMIPLQEELDWQMYRAYGLCDEPPLAINYAPKEVTERLSDSVTKLVRQDREIPDAQEAVERAERSEAQELSHSITQSLSHLDALPSVKLGERPFEIVLARKMEAGNVNTSWFERHGSTPRTDIPERWPEWYRELVRDRIECIENERFVRLIEKPEFKRRWNLDDWDKLEQNALRQWLGDRLETPRYFPLTARMAENPARDVQQAGKPVSGSAGEHNKAVERSSGQAVEQDKAVKPSSGQAVKPAEASGDTEIAVEADGELDSSTARQVDGLAEQSGAADSSTARQLDSSAKRSEAADADPQLTTVSRLAHKAMQDEPFMLVAERYTGDPNFDVEELVREIVFEDSVPYLPSQRYTESGVKRRKEWERVWDLQRIEDGEKTFADCLGPTPEHLQDLEDDIDDIPKPPKYRVADYEERRVYDNRGKLDVPKERFIHYPGLEGESEDDMVVAWAGYDHLEQARALATFYYQARNRKGWTDTDHGRTQLTHILAGLLDLLPWLHQWHHQPDPDGTVWPDFVTDMIESQAKELGVSLGELEGVRLGSD